MENRIKENIYKMSDILKGFFPYETYCNLCTFCVFLKYVLDNEKLPYDKTSFELQRMFDRAEPNKEALIKESMALEEQYKLPQSSLVDLAQIYIGFNDTKKSYNVATKVLNELKEISFAERGEEIVGILKEIFYSSAASFGKIMSDKITSRPLSNLIKELINVQDGEHYADFTYGIGISTLEIVGDKNCSITGYEINRSHIAVAGMLLIMSGRDNVNLIMGDVLDIEMNDDSFDKIVTMPPLGMRVKELSTVSVDILKRFHLPQKQLNMDSLILLKSLAALKKDGIAVVTVTPSFLFSRAVMDKEIRKQIVKKYLNAVIQLPNLYYGSGISTIMLILEKQKQADNVLFVDASTNEYFRFFDKPVRPIANLTESGIAKIKEIYQERRSEEGVSNIVTTEEIEENEFLLTLVKYIKVKSKKKIISNKEIDKRLKKLYSELKDILDVEGLL